MDPIAHTLFGATMSEAGLKKMTPLATATVIIGANIPDVDILASLAGHDYSLLFRRGWTHGILAMVLWPFLLTGLMLACDRWRLWRSPHKEAARAGPLFALSCLAVLSHPLLDWLNTYGIRLLMPFDDRWFYGDTLFIIDIWMWLLLGSVVVLARSSTRLSKTGWVILGVAASALITGTAEVPPGAKIAWYAGIILILLARHKQWGKDRISTIATASLAVYVIYLAFMFYGTHSAAVTAIQQLAQDDIEVHRIMPGPVPAHPFIREGVVESNTHYYRFSINWTDINSFRLLEAPIPITEPDRIVRAALESPNVRGMREWMRFPVYEVLSIENGWRVIIRDLRYVSTEQEEIAGIGIAIVDLDDNLQTVN